MSTVEAKLTPIQQLDNALLNYASITGEIERLKHNQKLAKQNIEKIVRDNNLGGHQIPIPNTDKDIKVSVSQKQVRVLDYTALSADLGVTETDAKKKEVLMRAVAEGRLTMADYEGYHYYENQEKLSIRKVKGGA